MSDIVRVELSCPMCGKDHYTYASKEKLMQLSSPKRPHIQSILDSYGAGYRELFMTKYCSACQKLLFDSDENDLNWSLYDECESNEDAKLYNHILYVIEQDKRNK